VSGAISFVNVSKSTPVSPGMRTSEITMSKNLRLQLALSRFDVVGNFHAVPFLTEGNLQQFANGALVIHHQNVRHLAHRFFRRLSWSLALSSDTTRKLYNEFRTFVSL